MAVGAVGAVRRIDQVIPTIVEWDAVGHHTLEVQRVIRGLGIESEIFALVVGPGLDGRVRPLAELPRLADGSQWVLYQCSIGSPAAEAFAQHPAPKLLDYHNITPAELVERWLPHLGEEVRLGRRQLAELAPVVRGGLADSAFNEAELVACGYARTAVAPLIVSDANLSTPPDRRRQEALARAKQAGGTDWLFVGQLLPHKAHHEVVEAFACYRAAFDPAARLHLVGRPSAPAYARALERFVAELGLAAAVELAPSLTPAELAATYDAADVFVCLSEHEGFCAPVLEAMHHGVPVVAAAGGAVPETLGGAGLVLPERSPALVATAVHRVLRDEDLRRRLVAAGRSRAEGFAPARTRDAFARALEGLLQASEPGAGLRAEPRSPLDD